MNSLTMPPKKNAKTRVRQSGALRMYQTLLPGPLHGVVMSTVGDWGRFSSLRDVYHKVQEERRKSHLYFCQLHTATLRSHSHQRSVALCH